MAKICGLVQDPSVQPKDEGLKQFLQCRYFSTQHSAASGSFVREEKVRGCAAKLQTLLEALKKKYEGKLEEDEQSDLKIDRHVRVQLVGMAKLREQRGGIERLQEVSLQDAAISSAVRFPALSIKHVTCITMQ